MKVEITRWKTSTKEDKHRKGSIKKCVVEIGYGDHWNADFTLAVIAAPLLKRVKENKQGAPCVDDEDVPEELRSTSCAPKENEWDTDENFFKRWDFAMDEMIFAMEEIANGNANEPSPYTKEGEMVFGEIDKTTGVGPISFEGYEETEDSRKAYIDYYDRIRNGCRLFGLHFTNLWT